MAAGEEEQEDRQGEAALDPVDVGGSDSSSSASGSANRGPLLSWDKQRFLIIAEEELIRRCMTDQGFEYQVILPPQILPEDAGTAAYRIRDDGGLRANGYGLADSALNEDEGNTTPNDANAAYVQTLSPEQQDAYSAALLGTADAQQTIEVDGMAFSTNTNGCTAEAANMLFGDQIEHGRLFVLVESYKSEVGARIGQSPEFQAAVDLWADCMAQRGYNVVSLDDGARLAQEGYASSTESEARAAEIQIATAEADCLIDSDLRTIVQQLEDRHFDAVLGERSGEIIAYREMQEAAIDRAKDIVGDQ